MSRWARVFAGSDAQPTAEAIASAFGRPEREIRLRGDEHGWFQAAFAAAPDSEPLVVQCYRTDTDDIRHELNAWAAWLELQLDNPHLDDLMKRMIGSLQVYTVPLDRDAASALVLARQVAKIAAGVYQVDGQGFFDAEGRLLVPEKASDGDA